MIRRFRAVVAVGLSVAVGVAAIALADGASDNVSTVYAKVAPKKLPKKTFKPVTLRSGVTTESPGNFHPDQATEEVYIDYDNDIKLNLRKAAPCLVNLDPMTTQQAKDACPNSIISSRDGAAEARIPPATVIGDFSVTAFRGATQNDIILKSYSPTAGFGPAVLGTLGKAPGRDFGQRLSVPDAPDVAGDAGALTLFNAIISRKYVKARCKDRNKTLNVKALFVYDDGSSDRTSSKQRCTVKR